MKKGERKRKRKKKRRASAASTSQKIRSEREIERRGRHYRCALLLASRNLHESMFVPRANSGGAKRRILPVVACLRHDLYLICRKLSAGGMSADGTRTVLPRPVTCGGAR